MDIEQARVNMIEQQIRTTDVLDPVALETLGMVKRERFVASAHQALAFAEMELPLACGQSMFTPVLEARVLQALAPRRGEHVLEIGTGSGFMAALLAVRAESVCSLEIEPALVSFAQANLQRAGVDNVDVVQIDGSQGWSAGGPYDVILGSGAVREIPPAWLAQLKVGGRLLAFVGEAPLMRARLVNCVAPGEYAQRTLFETVVPALSVVAKSAAFAL